MGGMLVAIGSAKGSPGVTTLALALAACWPVGERMPGPLVVEADPSGGDVAARFGLSEAPGLVTLAAAARRPASPQVLAECVQLLPGGVHAVVGPAGGRQAAAAVSLFAGNGAGLLRSGMGTAGSVMLDVGRFQAETAGLVQQADRLLLVTRGDVESLAHASGTVDEWRAVGRSSELVVVGPTPYAPAEISRELDVEQVHTVPWDPGAASVLSGRNSMPARHWRRSALVRGATALACSLMPAPGRATVPARSAGPRHTGRAQRQPLVEAGENR